MPKSWYLDSILTQYFIEDWFLFSGFDLISPQMKEMLSKQAVQTKQMISKQAVKIAQQAEEHERFINKVGFFIYK